MDDAECTACGRWLDEYNRGPRGEVVCSCGYINLVTRAERSLPLARAMEQCVPPEMIRMIVRDTNDPDYVIAAVNTAMDYCLQRLRGMVQAEPEAAQQAVWRFMTEFDAVSLDYRRGDREMGARMMLVSRAAQILLACLYEAGLQPQSPPGELSGEPSEALRRFVGQFSALSTSTASLGNVFGDLEWGMAQGVLQGGQLLLKQTPLNNHLAEWQVNRDVLWQRTRGQLRGDSVFSEASAQAQEVFLGCSPAEGRTLFADKHQLLRELSIHQEETVYEIPKVDCPPDILCLFEHLALTPERVARFAVPFYWDLGVEGVEVGEDGEKDQEKEPGHDVHKLAVRNWLNYYPVVPAVLASGEPGYYVSAEALTYGLSNLESYKGRLLQRIHDKLKSGEGADPAKREAVGRLRKAANTRLEQATAEAGRELGWEAADSLYKLDGKALPGGEIDVLMAKRQPHAQAHAEGEDLFILLIEVKDFDMTLHRMHGHETLAKKVREAEAQLARKASDIRQHWPRLLEEVAEGRLVPPKPPEGRVILVKALVTADLLPAFLSTDYPAVSLEGLGEFTEMLSQGEEDFPPRFAEKAWEVLA